MSVSVGECGGVCERVSVSLGFVPLLALANGFQNGLEHKLILNLKCKHKEMGSMRACVRVRVCV